MKSSEVRTNRSDGLTEVNPLYTCYDRPFISHTSPHAIITMTLLDFDPTAVESAAFHDLLGNNVKSEIGCGIMLSRRLGMGQRNR